MKVSKKIVLLGHYGVGKTSIIRQFVTNEFSTNYQVTIGVHILKKELHIKHKDISLILWDIEGTNDLELIRSAYLLGSHAFIFAYDLCRPNTYNQLLKQIESLKQKYPKTICKVVGNKLDLIDTVDTTSIDYKTILEHTDYLTSAKTGENIERLFNDLATNLVL
ncbi:Rab family GTPase [uncultured Winogradskyella sp.]|uniref:Rab family GTPase n=1 Tax=uncultured Winogradskyella sp. TaxID=395353 RepID=UPI002614047D|nr:Rab family GTPase [uncultured Winogradskyella sp.]